MAEAKDDPLSKLMTKLPRLKKAPLELYWELRVFGLPPHVPVYITLSDALEMIGGDRMLNISIIQLWCMYMDTIVVDQGRSSMYGFVEPQTIQPSGNTLQNRQDYLQTWMDESKIDVYLVPYIDGSHWQLMVITHKQCKIIWFCSLHRRMKNDLRTMLRGVIGKSRGQLVQILYPKVCNQQLDSWECGFYVMCWIKTIIRAVITDDWNERFKKIIGRKGSGKSWFQLIGKERTEVSRPGPSIGQAVGQPCPPVASTEPVPVVLSMSTDETIAAEVPLVRKRKTKAVDISREASKKKKAVVEETERPLPQGVWDPAFTLGHKVDLQMDASEKRVFENMSEQEIADTMLEMTTRTQALAWHLAYASDRGRVRTELEKVRAELEKVRAEWEKVRAQLQELTEVHAACDANQKHAEQLLKEAETLLNATREAGSTLRKERDQLASELEQTKRAMVVLARERNELKAEASERNELVEELKDAIMSEHTKGFRKALRQARHLLQVSTEGVAFDVQKDVYEDQLKPLDEIPEDAVLEGEEEEEVVANTEQDGVVEVSEPAADTVEEVVGDTPNSVID
ncbi:hypothetical protein LR48_Vigan06g040100 [Vigna angularis]|uniref:Ubiquitin-like protease family profile domain-containing protein n=1 Tax=Phaseolus angularis TaxID=3914 RepID=A0A0L9UQD0_PHAAN|nr:hypothetical protein LR48_Vigan06g040100 [Vigna angularis]